MRINGLQHAWALACLTLAAVLTGCGGGGSGTEEALEEFTDTESTELGTLGKIDCSTVDPAFLEGLDLRQFEKDLAIETDPHLLRLLDEQPELLCATLYSERGGGDVTALTYAVVHRPNLKTIFPELIERGADPSPAVPVAARLGKTRYLSWLLEAGADPNAGDALVVAAASGQGNVVKALLEAGADPSLRAQDSEYLGDAQATALHYATAKGRTAMMQMLIDAGADVDAVNREGAPPLQEALKIQNAGAVRLLMENNAYPHIMEERWVKRLRDMAKRYGMTDIVDQLDR